MKRTLAIGDIHGCRNALLALRDSVRFSKEDHIVILGDMIDRGPDSKGVIDELRQMRKEGYDLIFLRGNHEVMMEQSQFGNTDQRMGWLGVGGAEAVDSFAAKTIDDIPGHYWDFLKNLEPWHETETHIFVHAGASPDLEMSEQPDYQLYWEFFDFPERHHSGKTVICGHSSQDNGYPLSVGHAVCIDTKCYAGQWLTCLEVNSEYCLQANEKGETREGSLEEMAAHN